MMRIEHSYPALIPFVQVKIDQWNSTHWIASVYRVDQCLLACLDEHPGMYIQHLRGYKE